MKRKIIDIMQEQFLDFCCKNTCSNCPCYVVHHKCLQQIFQETKNPTILIKYLFSLDEGHKELKND